VAERRKRNRRLNVVVIDDEPRYLGLFSRRNSSHSSTQYKLFEQANDAFRYIENHEDEIDALIVDLVLDEHSHPSKDGEEQISSGLRVVEECHKRGYSKPILIISNNHASLNTEDQKIKKLIDSGVVSYLNKRSIVFSEDDNRDIDKLISGIVDDFKSKIGTFIELAEEQISDFLSDLAEHFAANSIMQTDIADAIEHNEWTKEEMHEISNYLRELSRHSYECVKLLDRDTHRLSNDSLNDQFKKLLIDTPTQPVPLISQAMREYKELQVVSLLLNNTKERESRERDIRKVASAISEGGDFDKKSFAKLALTLDYLEANNEGRMAIDLCSEIVRSIPASDPKTKLVTLLASKILRRTGNERAASLFERSIHR